MQAGVADFQTRRSETYLTFLSVKKILTKTQNFTTEIRHNKKLCKFTVFISLNPYVRKPTPETTKYQKWT